MELKEAMQNNETGAAPENTARAERAKKQEQINKDFRELYDTMGTIRKRDFREKFCKEFGYTEPLFFERLTRTNLKQDELDFLLKHKGISKDFFKDTESTAA